VSKSPSVKQMQDKLENMPLQLTTCSPVWWFDENRVQLMDRLMMHLAFATNSKAYRVVDKTRARARPHAYQYTTIYGFIGESMKKPEMAKLLRDFMDRIYVSQFSATPLAQIESTIVHARQDQGERIIRFGSGLATPRDYNERNPLPTEAWSLSRNRDKQLIARAFGPSVVTVSERVRSLPVCYSLPDERRFLVMTVRRKDYRRPGAKPFDNKQITKSKELVDHLLALGFTGVRRKYVVMKGACSSPLLSMYDSIRYEFPIDSNLNLLNWREFHRRLARVPSTDSLL